MGGVAPPIFSCSRRVGYLELPYLKRWLHLGSHKVVLRRSELDHHDAQRAFALLKLFIGRHVRDALRWLVGVDGHNWHAAGYRRVRERCENDGVSPWDVLSQLESGTLRLPHTTGIVERYREVVDELAALGSTTGSHRCGRPALS